MTGMPTIVSMRRLLPFKIMFETYAGRETKRLPITPFVAFRSLYSNRLRKTYVRNQLLLLPKSAVSTDKHDLYFNGQKERKELTKKTQYIVRDTHMYWRITASRFVLPPERTLMILFDSVTRLERRG